MKTKFISLILSFTVFSSIFGQNQSTKLTFVAQENSAYVQLDSILIENIAQGGDTTLYYPDTILVLDIPTGLPESNYRETSVFYLSQNHPNPISGKTSISLFLPEKGVLHFFLFDLTGSLLMDERFPLERGEHTFLFFSGQKNFYFLTAQLNAFRKTIKMINNPLRSIPGQSCRLEYIGRMKTTVRYKNKIDKNNFVFAPGDLLKFTAYSNSDTRVITDPPPTDRIYYFQYSGTPCPGTPTFTDADGNVYNTVLIGNQCWMKENLKTTTYSDGIPIPNVVDDSVWTNTTEGAYAWYDNNSSWSYAYGALYNWFAVDDAHKLCPAGWHSPTHDEWNTFDSFLAPYPGGNGEILKSCRQINYAGLCNSTKHPRWEANDSHHGLDSFGFTGFPAGARFDDGTFQHMGIYLYLWTGTAWPNSNESLFWYMYYLTDSLTGWPYPKNFGFSVRCLKNSN